MSNLSAFRVNTLPVRTDGTIYCERPLTAESKASLSPFYTSLASVMRKHSNVIEQDTLVFINRQTLRYRSVNRGYSQPMSEENAMLLRAAIVRTALKQDEEKKDDDKERFTDPISIGIKHAEMKAIRNQAQPLSQFCVRLCLDSPQAISRELECITSNLPTRQILDPSTKLTIARFDLNFTPGQRSPVRDMQEEVAAIPVPDRIQFEPWIVPKAA